MPWDDEVEPASPAPVSTEPVREAPPESRRRRALRWAWRVASVLTFVGLIALWAVTLRPVSLGGPATYLTVSGRSMQPTLRGGDLVILHERETYATGDIVAYRIPAGEPGAGNRVIHRIVGGSGSEGYVTRGDNRTSDDQWRPTDEDVLGKLWVRAPGVGQFLPQLRAPLIVATLAAILAVWLVFDWWRKPKADA
ncbi:MAG: signal peptidase I [Dehalococcoidia bacterium]